MAIRLPRIRREIAIVEDNKSASLTFQQWLDIAFKQIETSVTRIELALAAAGIALDQSGQALTVAIRKVPASGAVLSNDYIILSDATSDNIVLDLPLAGQNEGAIVVVKKIDSSVNTVTIEPAASETIDGATNKVLSTQYQKITIVSDGTQWWEIA
jgi:hypothetical protein